MRRVNPAALPLVRCYSIRLPRRVASWVNYSSWRTESSSEHLASDLSLLKADAPWCENTRCLDSNPWPMDPKASVLPTTPQRLTRRQQTTDLRQRRMASHTGRRRLSYPPYFHAPRHSHPATRCIRNNTRTSKRALVTINSQFRLHPATRPSVAGSRLLADSRYFPLFEYGQRTAWRPPCLQPDGTTETDERLMTGRGCMTSRCWLIVVNGNV